MRKRKVVIVVAILAVVLLGGVLAFILWPRGAQPEKQGGPPEGWEWAPVQASDCAVWRDGDTLHIRWTYHEYLSGDQRPTRFGFRSERDGVALFEQYEGGEFLMEVAGEVSAGVELRFRNAPRGARVLIYGSETQIAEGDHPGGNPIHPRGEWDWDQRPEQWVSP